MQALIALEGRFVKNAWFAALCALMAASAVAHGPAEHQALAPASGAPSPEETAFGRAGDPARVHRTIEVAMSDAMRYDPAEIRVKRGETVRLVVTNRGRTLHEIVLGTKQDLRQHAELMKRFPDMQHEEAYMAHVQPGASEALVWQFTRPGTFYYGCLLPGHFEAGMVGKVVVERR